MHEIKIVLVSFDSFASFANVNLSVFCSALGFLIWPQRLGKTWQPWLPSRVPLEIAEGSQSYKMRLKFSCETPVQPRIQLLCPKDMTLLDHGDSCAVHAVFSVKAPLAGGDHGFTSVQKAAFVRRGHQGAQHAADQQRPTTEGKESLWDLAVLINWFPYKVIKERQTNVHLNLPKAIKYLQRSGLSLDELDSLNVIHVGGTKVEVQKAVPLNRN